MTRIGLCDAAQGWFPNAAVSWYYVSDDLKGISYTQHGRQYGVSETATAAERYLISFYWVAATITSNGWVASVSPVWTPVVLTAVGGRMVGDIIPSNMLEIVLCIMLMIFNLTLFRWRAKLRRIAGCFFGAAPFP
jgi:hypothetical protein